jgi:hypothetical protein
LDKALVDGTTPTTASTKLHMITQPTTIRANKGGEPLEVSSDTLGPADEPTRQLVHPIPLMLRAIEKLTD